MDSSSKDLSGVLNSQIFSNLLNSSNIRIAEFDALITLLIKAKIPFDVEYSPGTRRVAESALLIIFINPTTTLNITIDFQSGTSIFSGTQL